MGLYWEVCFRIKILVKKKKKKKNTEPSGMNQITLTSLRRNFYWPFSPSKEQRIKFSSSNQSLDFQYQKENDQEYTVKNPALKSLGR